jgi:anion-transporting  ArsA/GET3 family ATPase
MACNVKIFVGTGGVGKTTMAVAAGLGFAKKGQKVLVITIDPSLRLKDLLGLPSSGEVSRVQISAGELPEGGELWGAVLNSKRVFDHFVYRCAQDKQSAEKLFRNKLYQKLSTSLAGSQEFTALEFLLTHVEKGLFDKVILDTPPSHHVLDFLRAPQKLSQIFQDRIAKWFKPRKEPKGFFSRIFISGSKRALNILESLTGSEFIHELADFFDSVDDWREHIDARIQATHQLLVSKNTEFYMVLNLDRAKAMEGLSFAREIQKNGYQLKGMIVNRASPFWQDQPQMQQELVKVPQAIRSFYDAESAYFKNRYEKIKEILEDSHVKGTGQAIKIFDVPEVRKNDDWEELWLICQFLDL